VVVVERGRNGAGLRGSSCSKHHHIIIIRWLWFFVVMMGGGGGDCGDFQKPHAIYSHTW
jgi:hypothetical protein